LSLEPTVTAARWQVEVQPDTDARQSWLSPQTSLTQAHER
jgi:hypothetical protein